MRSLAVRLAILGAVAVVFGGATFSKAVLTASSSNPSNTFASANAFDLSALMLDPGAYLRTTVSLEATAADGEDGSSIASVTIERSPAGADAWTDVCTDPSSPYGCSFDTTTVLDGPYDLRATAVNDVGGSASSMIVANRRVDNTSPSATMNDPGAYLGGTVALTASGSDGGSGVATVLIQRSPAGAGAWTDVCIDPTSPYGCSFDTTAVPEGLYDLRSIATDNAGNTATSATIPDRRVDNAAPAVSMTNPGSPVTGSVSFSGTATDAGSGVASVTFQVSPAGLGTWSDACSDTTSPYSCSYDTSLLADGTYDYRAVGLDAAGNSGASSPWSGVVDNGFPTSTLTDPGAFLSGAITLAATAGDGAGSGIANVRIQRSPAGANAWTDVCTDSTSPYSCSFDTTLVADGLYDLRALATDNVAKTTVSVTVASRRVDNTSPSATMNDPGATLRLTVPLTASASDSGSGVASVTIQRSPAGLNIWTDVCTDTTSPYSCSFDTTGVSDGLYDFRAIALDNAGNGAISALVTSRRVDNTAPTTGLTDPGSPLRATVTLNATGTDTGGSGVANVTIQRSPAGLNTWVNVCTDTTSPYSCSWDTTGVGDGLYDLRSLATDNAGNATSSTVVASRVVDNTAPTGTDVQTTNVGAGTAGKAEAGDTIVLTFSEQIAPGTIVYGWDGTGTRTVTVTGSNGNQISIGGATLTSSFLTLGGGTYFQSGKTVEFASSTVAQSGSTVTITLGAPDRPQWVQTVATAGQISWPVATTLTDLAGNPITSGTVLEVQPPNDSEL